MVKDNYKVFGLKLSEQQLNNVIHAAEKGIGVTIRLKKSSLLGDHFLPLTQTQINRINKSKTGMDITFSAAQLKHCKNLKEKTEVILPLLAFLPLIFVVIVTPAEIAEEIS